MTATTSSPQSGQSPSTTALLTYVLVTPARNEAAFIEHVLRSVTSQTVLPLKWVIVSDGSTDGTDAIVSSYAERHAWIELLRLPERQTRHFAGKVHAFNAGYERVRARHFDCVGSLDADISFGPDYFEFLLGKLRTDPRLGLVGTPFREGNFAYDYRFTNIRHVSGACQLFRRECFEAIGGYLPIHAGGIDLAAVITARMKGWETKTFVEKTSEHHRKTQGGIHSGLRAQFRSGYHDYLMGMHPVWQLFRSVYQMSRGPLLVGGIALLVGYVTAWARKAKRPVPKELIAFRRKEEMLRLRLFFLGWLGSRGKSTARS